MNKFKNVEKILKQNFRLKFQQTIRSSKEFNNKQNKILFKIQSIISPITKSFSKNVSHKRKNLNSFSNSFNFSENVDSKLKIHNSNEQNLEISKDIVTSKSEIENDGTSSSNNLLKLEKNKNYSEITIDRDLLKQTTLKKLNEHIQIEKMSDETIRDLIKYRVFEDSVKETVERISKEVPEISEHVKFRNYINEIIDKDMQDELRNKEGLIILKKKSDPLIKYGIDYHHYRNFHDRDYIVDLKEVLEKDLFEKQRIIDDYVEENREKINEVLGYYENRIKFTKFNKFSYLIYQNNYLPKINSLRLNFFKQISLTGILTAALSLSNPMYCLILIPEYVSIIFTMFVLNKTIDQIILTENKQNLRIRTFNFLGLRKEIPGNTYEITSIRYMNKFQNVVLNLNDRGFLFVTRLLWRILKPIKNKNEKFNKEEEQKTTGKKNSNRGESDNIKKDIILDNFQSFHMIFANGNIFYLPADLSKQHEDTNEELLLEILNNNNQNILEYDYSEYEDRSTQLYELVENWKKEYAKKSHETYLTKEEKLQREYSKYNGNRDYSDKNTELTLKRNDGIDGTFVDNGYR